MIIVFGSFIWHVVLDLLGILVAIILGDILGDVVYTIYEQYMKHRRAKMSSIVLNHKETKELQKIVGNHMGFIDKNGNVVINKTKDGDGNGTKENR